MKKVKASETLVQTLKNWGIDHVYGLPGDSIDTVVDALRKEQEAIEFIHVRHEEVATLAAAAYTKINRQNWCRIIYRWSWSNPSSKRNV